jgi:HEPN domain-containing protein
MKRRSQRDLAELLLRKAAQDEMALRRFAGDSEIADEILGLHAQQAAEKFVKAVLAANGIRYEKTHNLAALVDSLEDAGIEAPVYLSEAFRLTPYADTIRYEEEVAESLDRPGAVALIEKVRAWAEDQVAAGEAG